MNSPLLHQVSKTARVSLPLALLVCIIFNTLWVEWAVGEGDLTSTQQQLDKITRTVQIIERKISKNLNNHDVVRKEMAKLDREIGKIHQRISGSKTKIANSKIEYNQLQAKKSQLDEALVTQGKLFKQQIVTAYTARSQSKWKLLLSQNSLQHAGRNAVIYDYIHLARVEEINRINQLAEQIRLNQLAIHAQQETLQNLLEKRAKEQAILEKVRQQKQLNQSSLEKRIQQDQANLKAEQITKQRLQKLLRKLRTKKSEGEFANNKGKLHWPVKGKIRYRFGENKAGVAGRHWSGASIQTVRGTEIHAIYPGTVVFSDWFDHYGWLMIIDHSDGYMSLYAHAEGLYKNVGDYVTQGELIAVVGDSGDVDQAGLYFEIRREGTPVDPANWCVHPKMAYSS